MDYTKPVRLSRFVHFIEVDDEHEVTAIYHALSQAVTYVSSGVVQLLKELGTTSIEDFVSKHFEGNTEEVYKFFDQLWQLRMLYSETEDETADVRMIRQVLEEPQIMILYLILTDVCNICCRYCFFEGGIPDGYKFSVMTWDTAKAGIDLFAATVSRQTIHDEDKPTIILYGGEALLNWEVAEQVLDYVAQLKATSVLPPNTGVTLNTNGILLTDEIASVLAQHNVSVAISVDGPKEIHDQMRVDRGGNGTFDRVMAGFETAKRAGCKVSACCTIDEHNLEVLPDVTRWLIEDLGIQGFGFNTLLECNARRISKPVPYSKAVAEALIECFQIARANGVHEDRFMRKVNAFAKGNFYFSDCGGCGMQLAVSPDGYVGTCHAYCGTKEYFVPLTALGDPITHPFWQEWRKRSPINMEACQGCLALANCGGGCPHSAAVVTGSIWNVDTSFCPHAQSAVEFLVKDLYHQHSR